VRGSYFVRGGVSRGRVIRADTGENRKVPTWSCGYINFERLVVGR
jgi:hypothetical protein